MGSGKYMNLFGFHFSPLQIFRCRLMYNQLSKLWHPWEVEISLVVGVTCTQGCLQYIYIYYICIYIHIYELQLKFSVMESSIRDIFCFGNWAGAWKTIMHSSNNDNICYIPKTWKTIIHSSKIDDSELYTKYWPWPLYIL